MRLAGILLAKERISDSLPACLAWLEIEGKTCDKQDNSITTGITHLPEECWGENKDLNFGELVVDIRQRLLELERLKQEVDWDGIPPVPSCVLSQQVVGVLACLCVPLRA